MRTEKRSRISFPSLIRKNKVLGKEVIKSKVYDFYQLSLVLDWSIGVAIGVQEHLGVGMDGDEGL